ncbi:hypothetical protein JI58_01805 [Marinosulfonomonas sp. PRT-SC04]|nr:hypothetical protein JI58_01805 [Marinosulfonomonas sp. PRT-SC04]
MTKTCLIIVDGLRYDTAIAECGCLAAAVEADQARVWKMLSCLPTISAPLYETIHTGLAPVDGVVAWIIGRWERALPEMDFRR